MQGAQMYARTMPPPKIRTIIAKVVHVAELGMTRLGTSLFIAGNSATSSVVRSHLLALAIRDLRRRDAFSQDFLDVRLDKPFSKQFSKCPIISPRVSFLSQFKRRDKVPDIETKGYAEKFVTTMWTGPIFRRMLDHDLRRF